MSAQTAKNIELDNYGADDGIFSTLLSYGLFIGAIFQVVCICASMFLPAASDVMESDSSVMDDPKQSIETARRQHKLRKQEKKKRR